LKLDLSKKIKSKS